MEYAPDLIPDLMPELTAIHEGLQTQLEGLAELLAERNMFIYQKTVQQYGPLVSDFLDILQQYLNNTLVDLFRVVDNISILMRSYEQPLSSFAHHSASIIQSIESRIGEVQALVSQHSQTIEDLSDIATEVATLVEDYERKAYSHSSSSLRAKLISIGLNLAAIPAGAAAGGLATAVTPFSVVVGTICVVAGVGGSVSRIFSFYDRQKSQIYVEATIKLNIIQKCGEGFQAPIDRICVKLRESKLSLQHLQTLTSNATTGYNTADSNTTRIYQEAYEAAQLEALKINEMCSQIRQHAQDITILKGKMRSRTRQIRSAIQPPRSIQLFS